MVTDAEWLTWSSPVSAVRGDKQKLFLFLQHCFAHWPLDASFRAVLETWLSYIQPWRYSSDKANSQLEQKRSMSERWESFVQENLLMYTKLFQMFLSRSIRTDLVNAKNALMVFRVAKVFSQPHLADIIQKGEQLFLEPEHVLHHRTPRGHMTPSQGGSFLSSRQRLQTDAVFRVKSHIYALEGTDCTYTQMFGMEQRAVVLKLVQTIAQARHTAQRISDHSVDVSTNSSLLSWLGLGTSGTFIGTDPEDSGEFLKKTHEFLDRALENLCLIFKCNQVQLTQLISSLGSCDEDVTNQQLPDCVQTENGLMLTELGRRQVINGLRRFDLVYQGDPDLQPIRSYENAVLVRLFYRISSLLNNRLETPLATLCARTDLLGRVSRRLLTDNHEARLSRSPAPRRGVELSRRARLSLRPLASYRTLLLLLLLYLLGAVLSLSPACSLALLLAAGLALRLAL
ncbi:sphingomyelin phosphodiesterase 4 [Gouania willdenowi]|uniref:sphingomyelin phosphodiesterase 4 n=1 Tax=Gouania willdenowi TaxID=441366 RepID=UPI001054C70B|nr:sphingomyelin phosphodiesterase 4 [Gouania willdenowi]